MTLLQIECFVEAAKAENISKAANRLFMSQQSVSKHIKSLEKELDMPLFKRHNSGVSLTPPGEVLFRVWEKAVYEHRIALDRARDIYYGNQNTIRIGILDCGAYNETLVKNITAFNEHFPDITVEYEFLIARDLLDGIDNGTLDMVFIYESELGDVHEYNLLQVCSNPIRTGVFVSRKDPLARRPLDPAGLKGQTFGLLSEAVSRDHKEKTKGYLKRQGIEKEVSYRQYNARHNLGMALVTQKCITLAYETMFAHMKDKLAFLPIPELEGVGMIDLIWKRDRFKAKARNLADYFLRET